MLIDSTARSMLSRRSRYAAAALALSLLLPASRASAQTAEEKAAARAMATQAGEALAANKYAEAYDLVSRAEQMFHAPTHLLLMARAQVGLGRLVAAKESYLKLTREELAPGAPPAFKRAQQEAKDEMSALDPKIGSLRISIEGGGQQKFTVKMDDQPVSPALLGVYRPVDPGHHEVVVNPVGQGPVKGTVDLKDGEKKELKLSIPDAPVGAAVPPPTEPADAAGKSAAPAVKEGVTPPVEAESPGFFTPMRGAGIAFVAVGVAGAVVGGLFVAKGSSVQSQADQRDTSCRMQHACTPIDIAAIKKGDDEAASKKTIGAIGFAAGGVALAAGVTLIVLGKPHAKSMSGVTLTPWYSGQMGGVQGTF